MHTFHRRPTADVIAPDGIEIRNIIDEPQGAMNLSMAEGSLGPHQRSHKVFHTSYEEIWYFLHGAGVFHLHTPGGEVEESVPVAPGDAVHVPPQHGFWVENTGDGDLIFLPPRCV